MNKSYIYMLFAALCWAGAFVAGKIGSADVSGLEMSFYRFLIASVCLFIYIRIRRISFRIGLRKVLIICAIGSFGMIGYHLLFFKALTTISVLESSSINALIPVLSGFFGFILFKEPLNKKGVIFLLLASFGVLTIIIKWDFSSLKVLGGAAGTVYMFCAMLIWVLYSLLIRKFVVGIPAAVSSFISISISALILLPFIIFKGINPLSYSSNIWVVFMFMGIFSTFVGYTIQQDSIMKIGVARANFFINFVPVFSMFLGVIILKDVFMPMNILSLVLVFAGLAGYMKEKERLMAFSVPD